MAVFRQNLPRNRGSMAWPGEHRQLRRASARHPRRTACRSLRKSVERKAKSAERTMRLREGERRNVTNPDEFYAYATQTQGKELRTQKVVYAQKRRTQGQPARGTPQGTRSGRRSRKRPYSPLNRARTSSSTSLSATTMAVSPAYMTVSSSTTSTSSSSLGDTATIMLFGGMGTDDARMPASLE